VGRHPQGGAWEADWKKSIEDPLKKLDDTVNVQIEFVYLDPIFDKYPITLQGVLEAIGKLAKSATATLFAPQPKGFTDVVRWTAGMVVQWVENETLRQETRKVLEEQITKFKPHIVCAHSLGSLVCYDSFTGDGAKLIKDRRFVSFGSQIGNPFVVGNFAAGHLTGLKQAKFWYHLFNSNDSIFTAEIRLSDPNFAQIPTFFDIPGIADHDIPQYMCHPRTVGTVWGDAVNTLRGRPLERSMPEVIQKKFKWVEKPKARALLVGINEYSNPAQNLEGCVNDVFLMSALLQESGFEAENIRVVLNDRATHAGVRERLEWLLDGAQDRDKRFFYYSGHGAQMPTYDIGDQVDRLDEALVLYDFDWTRERAFTDDDFYALYSNLPYELQFTAVFDCCYSGGLTRAAVNKPRGIDPPDDIRHRMLYWDPITEMWRARKTITVPNKEFDERFNKDRQGDLLSVRLGQAMDLRTSPPQEMNKKAAARNHKGPYMPTLVYACREEEFSYEYTHGSITYGAFTYSLVKTLRRYRHLKEPKLTFTSLVNKVARELKVLGYEQTPTLSAPRDKRQKTPLG